MTKRTIFAALAPLLALAPTSSATVAPKGITTAAAPVATVRPAAAAAAGTSIRLSTLSLAGIAQHGETLGSRGAPVEMLYFGDPQCPFCLKWQTQVMPALVRRYVRAGKLSIRWHGYDVVGPDSLKGEKFVLAAGLQGHLWNAFDDILANQGPESSGWLDDALLEQIGAAIPGFSLPAAFEAAASPGIAKRVATEVREGNRYGLRGVPFLLVGYRGRPLRQVAFERLAPAEFERPIELLLHRRDGLLRRHRRH